MAIEMMPTRTLERLMRSRSSSGRKAPDDIGEIAIAKQAIFDEEDETQDEREAEGRVGEDAERDVECEDWAVCGRRRKFVADGGEIGGEEKGDDERHHERPDGALAMEEFEAEIDQREEPAEERERAVNIVVRNGVRAARAFEQSEIMSDEAE